MFLPYAVSIRNSLHAYFYILSFHPLSCVVPWICIFYNFIPCLSLSVVNLLFTLHSCYANAVLQCLTFTPPLTAYFLHGIHSKACMSSNVPIGIITFLCFEVACWMNLTINFFLRCKERMVFHL